MFRFVFRDKKEILQLYNAINQTDYSNPDDLIITTASKGDVDDYPLSGYVFMKKMNVKGKKSFRYKGETNMKKEHQVVLMRNGEKVEESILTYPTRKKAEEIAKYLNDYNIKN